MLEQLYHEHLLSGIYGAPDRLAYMQELQDGGVPYMEVRIDEVEAQQPPVEEPSGEDQ